MTDKREIKYERPSVTVRIAKSTMTTTTTKSGGDPAWKCRSSASNSPRVVAVATAVVGGQPEPDKRVEPSLCYKEPSVAVASDSSSMDNNDILTAVVVVADALIGRSIL